MLKSTYKWLGLLGVALCAGNLAVSIAPAADANLDRTVVIISVDGLAGHYLDDPKAEMPTIRALAAAGARASSMKAVAPTVTWPNHTTLVTGVYPAQHGVVGTNYFDRAANRKVVLISDPEYDKEQIVKAPTIYDLAKEKGMKTTAIRWPATRNAKTLDWAIPDVASVELMEKYSTASLLAECEQNGMSLMKGSNSVAKRMAIHEPVDEDCTQVFDFILTKHRPQLALLHIVHVDHTQHMFGPRSAEAYAAIKVADQQVKEVWDTLQKEFPNKATLFVVSDHGFSPIKKLILPNVVLRKAGIIKSGKKTDKEPVTVVSQGGAAMIYVLDTANRTKVLGQIKKAFTGMEGVARVVGVEQFGEYGVADPKKDPHAPDMILFGDLGYAFGDTAAGQLPFEEKPERKGSHGHDPSIPDLHATFVAWGAGIKSGARLGEIPNTQVAPTAAHLLGITIPGAAKPLSEILTQ